MTVNIENAENRMTAFLNGEIDHHCAKNIREEIDREVENVKPPQLVLDFKNVTFMDSSGIGLVMGRYRLMQTFGGRVTVKNASQHIRKVMRLAGLDKLAGLE